jgi:cytidine deaminase
VIGGPIDADGKPTGDKPVGPCGRCRQVINEAAQMGGRDVVVWCAGAEGDALERHLISELLPHAFGPGDLGID